MTYKIDHDYHIHSKLSLCSNDDEQTAENLLKYAEKNHLTEICVTDHFWDENVPAVCRCGFYVAQNFEHISQILPLPKSDTVKFFFGCEVEMDKALNIGISKALFDTFDFIIVPTNHMHFKGFTVDKSEGSLERLAYHYIERVHALMDADLPFEKIGFAHATGHLLAPDNPNDHLKVLDMISDEDFRAAFKKIAEKGAGFELNFDPRKYNPEELSSVLRPYKIAKEVGCKFYLGSDAHHPSDFEDAIPRAEMIIELLQLEESDKFRFW